MLAGNKYPTNVILVSSLPQHKKTKIAMRRTAVSADINPDVGVINASSKKAFPISIADP